MAQHIKLGGDTVIAARYVGLGMLMLKQLAEQKQMSSVMVLQDVRLEAKIVGGQKHLYIEAKAGGACSLYLESGHIEANNFHHNVPGASDPAILKTGLLDPEAHLFGTIKAADSKSFDTAKITVPNSVDTPAPNHFKSGEHSPKSFYKAPRLNETVPSVSPPDTTDGSGAAGTWPICILLEQKKRVVAMVAPSIYSGKMRLFVQSLFGADLAVFGTQNLDVLEGAPNKLKMSGVTFDFSDSIFTSDDGSYWLISLGSVVAVTRIKLTSCGTALSAWLVKNPCTDRAAQSEYEAYIFAGATLDTTFKLTLTNIPAISPIAYGWKFNWAGNEASCISLRADSRSAHDHPFQSSKQQIQLSRDSKMEFRNELAALTPLQKERMRWKITSSDTGAQSTFTFAWGTSFVWAPGWLNYQHGRVSGVDNFQVEYVGTANIYGWYDASDVWQTVQYTHGVSGVINESYTSHDMFPPGNFIYDGLNLTYAVKSLYCTEHIFTVGGTQYAVRGGTGTYSDGTFTAGTTIKASDVFTAVVGKIYAITQYCYTTYNNNPYHLEPPPYPPVVYSLGINGVSGFANTWNVSPFPTGGYPYTPTTDVTTLDKASQIAAQNVINYNDWLARNPNGYYTQTGYSVINTSTYARNLVAGSMNKSGAHAVVVPFFDSEAAYVFSNQVNTKTPTSQQYGAGYISSTFYGVPGLGCLAGGQTIWDAGVFLGWTEMYRPASECPITSTSITTAPFSETIRTAKCYKKDGNLDAIADNFSEIFDPSIQNQVLDQGNYCFTLTSAVYNYVNGSNVSPSHTDFAYNTGTFIGWF